MTIELTIWQLGEELALAIAIGVCFGIAIGIKLYESYGSDSKRTTTSAALSPRTTRKLGSCLEAR